MQLNSSAQGSGSESQCIALGPSPCAPFDDDGETEREKFLSELPLQSLDLLALPFVVKVQRKSVHPFIGSKADCSEPGLKQLGVLGLT